MQSADRKLTLLFMSMCYISFLFYASSGVSGQVKNKQLHIGDTVQDGINGIKVIKVERNSFFEDEKGRVLPSQGSHDLIVIELKVYRNGVPLNDNADRELVELSMLAEDGKVYPVLMNESGNLNYRYILYGADPQKALEKDGFNYEVFFSVPKKNGGLKLKYRNNLLIDLGKL